MSKYTIDDVKAAALRLATEHPKTRNPENGGGCIYTDKHRKRHCIAGQILVDLNTGLCPSYASKQNNGYSIDEVNGIYNAFEEDAVQLLGKLQREADCPEAALGSVAPRPWGQAVKTVLNGG